MGIYFIVNPVAGRGKTKSFIQETEELLKERKIDFEIAYTKHPGHATELAAQVDRERFSKLVSVGGDGTIHEILNGMNLETMTLGIIAAGTGNDLARGAGIPSDKIEALEVILTGQEKNIDIGIVNHRRFINVAGVGIDVEVLRETRKFKRVMNGSLAYVFGTMKAIGTFQAINLEFDIDGTKYKEEGMLCAICNGRYFGGGMKISPTAELDDGLLDICIIKKLSKIQLLFHFPKIFKGTHIGLPWVFTIRGKCIKVLSKDPIWVNADGEVSEESTPVFQVLEEGLRILVP